MESSRSDDVTHWLIAWRSGDREAADRLLSLVYPELRKIARGYLARERQDHTLQPTALVHEAYLRLVDQKRVAWQDRSHFFAIASKMIHRILVDHARRHRYAKRGAGRVKASLSEIGDLAMERPEQLVELDEALLSLEASDPLKASIVEYRFFGGLTAKEIAEVVGCSATTVHRHWLVARAWLYRELTRDEARKADRLTKKSGRSRVIK